MHERRHDPAVVVLGYCYSSEADDRVTGVGSPVVRLHMPRRLRLQKLWPGVPYLRAEMLLYC